MCAMTSGWSWAITPWTPGAASSRFDGGGMAVPVLDERGHPRRTRGATHLTIR